MPVGAMAGTVDLVQRCYTGIEMRDEVHWLNPCLPEGLRSLSLRIRYRGHWLSLEVTHDTLTVAVEQGWAKTAKIGVSNRVYEFEAGDVKAFALPLPGSSHRAGLEEGRQPGGERV